MGQWISDLTASVSIQCPKKGVRTPWGAADNPIRYQKKIILSLIYGKLSRFFNFCGVWVCF